MSRTSFANYPDIDGLKTRMACMAQSSCYAEDALQRLSAVAQDTEPPGIPTCKGNLSIGLFFDGTGNNETKDYGPPGGRKLPLEKRKHSNIVRLYHAFPDDAKNSSAVMAKPVDQRHAIYIPGVGTPFPEIGDTGGTLGSAAAWGGEPRILWGLIQTLNTIHWYYRQRPLIPDEQAKEEVNDLAYEYTRLNFRAIMAGHHQARRDAFGAHIENLKSRIPQHAKPSIREIQLSVFGFSRGAAQARAFVNWLLELCEGTPESRTLAGIPFSIQFMGLFDTVASVGIAGLYSFSEGRQSWAEDNLQVPTAASIRHCVHMVAAHEVRACFPLDSVRIDHRYPPNTTELVYPGAHSDVGGGYAPLELGKDDWRLEQDAKQSDLQLARIPCFDMYNRALSAGVPLYTLEQLKTKGDFEIAEALLPHPDTLESIGSYQCTADVPVGLVEDMVKRHTQHYHAWRWKLGISDYLKKQVSEEPESEYQRALSRNREKEPKGLRHTQHALIQVVAAYCKEIDRRMDKRKGGRTPLNNSLRPLQSWEEKVAARVATLPGGKLPGAAVFVYERRKWLTDNKLVAEAESIARLAPQKLAAWRSWLKTNFHPEWHDSDAEREAIWLLEAVTLASTQPDDIGTFFDVHVHDSMAGFIGFGMPEFEVNGYGLAKYRRLYFGNNGDQVLRQRVQQENEERYKAVAAIKAYIERQKTMYRNVPSAQEIFNQMGRAMGR